MGTTTAEAAAPQFQHLLGALFHHTPIGIAFFDAELRLIRVNPAFAKLTEHPLDAHAGQTLDTLAPEIGAQLRPQLQAALASAAPVEMQLVRAGRAGASERFWVGVGCPIADAGGRPAVGAFFREVTERTRAELERQAAFAAEQVSRVEAEGQRDFIRLVLDHAPMAVSVCEGPDFRLALINDFAIRLVAMPPESILGRPLRETFPDAFALVEQAYERVYRTGETVTLPDRQVPLPDGRSIWIWSTYAPLPGASGDRRGVMALVLDITALKQAQAAVDAQKRVLEMIAAGCDLPAILDTITTLVAHHSVTGALPAILLVDASGTRLRHGAVSHVPAAFASLLDGKRIGAGSGGCGLAAQTGSRVVTPDLTEDDNWAAYREAAVADGLRACWSTPIVGSDGAVLGTLAMYYRNVHSPAAPEIELIDLMVRAAALAIERARTDDERQRLLEAERRARHEAEAANRSKDEFVATLSHELRTPLNAILGWARLLRGGDLDAATQARALDAIERNTRSQSQLIEDLLDISRIVTGRLRLDVRSVELGSVLESAIDTVRPAAEAKEIRIQKVLDRRTAPIAGDPDRLQQVVWNLLSNAIKFTPRGGRVQIRLERVNSHVEIIVSDTGCGIAPELLPYVFDRFQQGQRAGTKSGGLGLGLAIAKHLVELHGGTIQASSTESGATFTVKLPVMVAHGDRTSGEVHPTASATKAPPLLQRAARVRVLLVEDDQDGREIAARILAAAGADVRAAGSAAEAMRLLREQKPEIIISDIEMPDEDGYAFINRVRQEPGCSARELPAVALTAYARVEDRIKALAAGFQMHVPKPVEPAELVAVINALVPSATGA